MLLAKQLVTALGGLSSTIHAVVDALGHPLGFQLTPRQACYPDGADVLLDELATDALLID
ncbi:MAG: hypothetical protein F6J89_08270 [Symploca sp. SIO1C4]|uniref:Uncharacterized protein n=1 Tax=Symploca sp. SIO1C4 TaxID=2607765 RepID=A0A6B3N1Q8_9CYAN|nr:hypothetical protein [Symploca sp. SIO1C4]